MHTEPEFLTVLLATGNRGKITELRKLLGAAPVTLIGLSDLPADIAEVAETGSTFAENAALKAAGYARQSGLPALADDSGLVVDALNGEPGVLSARYGGADLTFEDKMALVLRRMESAESKERSARFICAIALARADGSIVENVLGTCEGTIASSPRGNGGFGYDPIFIPEGFDQTFGELGDAVKVSISHRALAAAKIMRYLLAFTGRLT